MRGAGEGNELEELAARIDEGLAEPADVERFARDIAKSDEVARLWKLAKRYFSERWVSEPALRRLAGLQPASIEPLTYLAGLALLYPFHLDAMEFVHGMRRLDPDSVDALLVEAATCRDVPSKIALYEQVLRRRPDDVTARGQLKELRGPGAHGTLRLE